MTVNLRVLLAALAYASSALAAALTLSVVERGVWGWVATAWFAAAFWVVWGASGGKPVIPGTIRRGVDAAGAAVMLVFLFVALGTDGDWRPLVPIALVILQMLRAFVVTTPGESESFLATGLALALYCATRVGWELGTVFLGAFMWLWLGAMVLVQVLSDSERRERAGGIVAAIASPWRTLKSGLTLSLLVVALGFGAFLVVVGPAGRGGGAGAGPGPRGGGRPGVWRYDTGLSFASQAGPHGEAVELYRIRAPRSVSRFRLQAFDTYAADGWSLSRSDTTALREGAKVEAPYGLGLGLPSAVEGASVDIEVAAVGDPGDAVLTAGWPVEFAGAFPGPLIVDEEGGVRAKYQLPSGFRYRIRVWRPAWERLPLSAAKASGIDRIGQRYFALPADLPRRLSVRAGEWGAGSASAWDRVFAIAEALRSGIKYQVELAVPPAAGADPVDWFVMEGSHGNCVNFASSLAVLARAAGVPARLVVGYLGHKYDADAGEWTITGVDAHAWCEIPLEGVGWVPVDATPSARFADAAVGGTETPAPSAEPVTGPAAAREEARLGAPSLARMSANIKRALAVAGPWIILGWGLLWLGRATWRAVGPRIGGRAPRRARRAAGRVQRAFQWVCEAAARRGKPRRDAQTPVEYARSLRALLPALAADIVRLAELATQAESAAEGPDPKACAEAEELGRRLAAAVRKG